MSRRKVAMVLGLVLLVVGTPAHGRVNPGAISASLAFVGKMHLTKAVCYPVAFCNPGNATYTFAASTKKPDPHGGPSDCVGVEVASKKSLPVRGPKCDLQVAGVINVGPLFSPNGPHCYDSTGTASGTVRFYLDQATKNTVSFVGGWPVIVGHHRLIIGTATKSGASGPALILLFAEPDLLFKGDSCSTGADDFKVTGVGQFLLA